MLRKLYKWVLGLAGGPKAEFALAAVSFAESSFFPIPPDVMLLPMVLERPERAFRYAGVCAAASVIGGCLGYAIGYFAAPFGQSLLAMMGHADSLPQFQALYAKYGLAVILIKGLTPVPYKLVTIASGIAKFNFGIFVAASTATRSARFFLEAFAVSRLGPKGKEFIEKRLEWILMGFLALIVLGFVAIHFLMPKS